MYLAGEEGSTALRVDSAVQSWLAAHELAVLEAGPVGDVAELGRIDAHDFARAGDTKLTRSKAGQEAKECNVLLGKHGCVQGEGLLCGVSAVK